MGAIATYYSIYFMTHHRLLVPESLFTMVKTSLDALYGLDLGSSVNPESLNTQP